MDRPRQATSAATGGAACLRTRGEPGRRRHDDGPCSSRPCAVRGSWEAQGRCAARLPLPALAARLGPCYWTVKGLLVARSVKASLASRRSWYVPGATLGGTTNRHTPAARAAPGVLEQLKIGRAHV